ncbi:hypothetical protein FR224_17000 [Salmonella enterica subsp. diarizonae]|uniref:Uncharacterized protein n=1 Tax=Salmonella muenchen TaxID=596 RepID=A0A5W3IP84_SALMU|nr:hypothetical protein [Salmonella enterica subsp. enterica serovar Muenchen]ECJ2403567.1 hypothetical protein [Salmonella enterica subsp. diarizonae]ECK8188163.1 hypothetical protein [Salmonella enterica subsp. diarizonae]EDU5553168.1 hypothetical protein [Salmonella enterica subsp. diarizonae]HAK8098676.1 hypothetical protein [Salmonella enterica]
MTLIIQSEAYIIGIEKALDDSERTVGNIFEPQEDCSLLVVATFNAAVKVFAIKVKHEALPS